MITGFNTDIKYDGVTYHVQTEDKGVKTPLILSLVYQGGTILASKRSPYEDLVSKNFDEKVLEKRLNRQHNLICAAIRAGRIEDLKRMTQKRSAAKESEVARKESISNTQVEKQAEVSLSKVNASIPKVNSQIPALSPIDLKSENKRIEPEKVQPQIAEKPSLAKSENDLPKLNVAEVIKEKVVSRTSENDVAKTDADSSNPAIESRQPDIPKPIQKQSEQQLPKPSEEPVWDIPIIEDVTIVEDDLIEENQELVEEIILPSDAVEIVGDLEQFGPLLEDELKVKILGENFFKSGDRKNLNILVCRGSEESAVASANVMIKVIGSDFRPMIFHSKADSNGVATVFLKLPAFRSGRAAIIVRAMVDGEETELRRAISPE